MIGDGDCGEIGAIKIGRGNISTRRKPAPNAALSITNPTCCPDTNPGRRGEKPATNRLSSGAVLFWEISIPADIQEMTCPSWNSKAHYTVQRSLPIDPYLWPINSVHMYTDYFFKVYFNIILLSITKSPRSALPFNPSEQQFLRTSHLTYAWDIPNPSHPWIDHPNAVLDRTLKRVCTIAFCRKLHNEVFITCILRRI
jgi:hypothetical protein